MSEAEPKADEESDLRARIEALEARVVLRARIEALEARIEALEGRGRMHPTGISAEPNDFPDEPS